MNEPKLRLTSSSKGSFSLFSRLSSRGSSPAMMKKWIIWFFVLLSAALVHDMDLMGQPADAAPKAVNKTEEDNNKTEAPHKGDASTKKKAEKEHAGGGHSDPVAPVLISIALILLLAKLGGDLAERISMPAVLGELVVGILLGNAALMTGYHGLDFFKPAAKETSHETAQTEKADAPKTEAAHDEHAGGIDTGTVLQMLAGIGVVLLLFEVGLESSVREMMQVGLSSFLVAILGVVAPMLLGYGVTMWILPDAGWEVPAFVGATLCATSVGITARVLKDLGKSHLKESKIILGAAVIDDVMGLIVLAVVSGIIVQTSGTGSDGAAEGSLAWKLTFIVLAAVGFLAGALALGAMQFPRLILKSAVCP